MALIRKVSTINDMAKRRGIKVPGCLENITL
jgi:hypothetical protein